MAGDSFTQATAPTAAQAKVLGAARAARKVTRGAGASRAQIRAASKAAAIPSGTVGFLAIPSSAQAGALSPTQRRAAGIISPTGEARQWLSNLYAQHSHTAGLPQIRGDVEAIARWRMQGRDISGEVAMAAENYGVSPSTIEAAVANQVFITQQQQIRAAKYKDRGGQLREYARQRREAGHYIESFPEFQRRMGYKEEEAARVAAAIAAAEPVEITTLAKHAANFRDHGYIEPSSSKRTG